MTILFHKRHMPTSVANLVGQNRNVIGHHILRFSCIFFKYTLDCNCRSTKPHSRMSERESYAHFDLFKYINISYFQVLNFVGHGEIFVGHCMSDE